MATTPPPAARPFAFAPRAQVFAIGLQKSGTTIMSRSLAAVLNRSYQGEAVDLCCRRIAARGESCCRDPSSQLFDGSMERFVGTCSEELDAEVLKAADVLEEFEPLRVHALAVGLRFRFIYLVRHPVANIKSLQAWKQFLRKTNHYRDNVLAVRVFRYGSRTEDLARKWRDHARVYLRNPSAFASLLRYEDFVRRPVDELRRVSSALLGPQVRFATLDAAATLAKQLRKQHTDGGRGKLLHGGNVSKLMRPAELDAVVRVCGDEMQRFGYSRADSFAVAAVAASCRWRSERLDLDAAPPVAEERSAEAPEPTATGTESVWTAASRLWGRLSGTQTAEAPPPAPPAPALPDVDAGPRRVAVATVFHEPAPATDVGGRLTCALLVHLAATRKIFPSVPYVVFHDLPAGAPLFQRHLLPLLQTRNAQARRVPPLLRFGRRKNIKYGEQAAAANPELAATSSMKLWALNMTEYDAVLFMDLDALPLALPQRTDPFAALLRRPHAKLLGARGPTAPIAGNSWVARPDRGLFEDMMRTASDKFTPERGWAGSGRFTLRGHFAPEHWPNKDCAFWAQTVKDPACDASEEANRSASPLPWHFWAAEGDNGLLFWLYVLREGAGTPDERPAFVPDLDEHLEIAHFTHHRQPWKPTTFFKPLEAVAEAAKRKSRRSSNTSDESESPAAFKARKMARILRDGWCSHGHAWWDRWKRDVSSALLCDGQLPCVADLNSVLKRHVGKRLLKLCPKNAPSPPLPPPPTETALSLWEHLLSLVAPPLLKALPVLGLTDWAPSVAALQAGVEKKQMRVEEWQEKQDKKQRFLERQQARRKRKRAAKNRTVAEGLNETQEPRGDSRRLKTVREPRRAGKGGRARGLGEGFAGRSKSQW